MARKLKDLLSPAAVIAMLALVVALGGTGVAAAQLSHTAQRAVAQPTLSSGATMVGYFAAGGSDGASGWMADAITFPKRLPSTFNHFHVQYIGSGDSPTTKCPGLGRAARGWMCLYEGQVFNADEAFIYDQNYNSEAVAPYGARIYWAITGASSYADGQWVVRAP